jgi:hypothetical protein
MCLLAVQLIFWILFCLLESCVPTSAINKIRCWPRNDALLSKYNGSNVQRTVCHHFVGC